MTSAKDIGVLFRYFSRAISRARSEALLFMFNSEGRFNK
jgi:hypothetical protein